MIAYRSPLGKGRWWNSSKQLLEIKDTGIKKQGGGGGAINPYNHRMCTKQV